MSKQSLLQAVIGLSVALCTTSVLIAQPGRDKEPLSWDRNVQRLFSQYCYRCHDSEEPSGDVNLARDVDPRLIQENRKQWRTALEMLRSDQMPPPDERSPQDPQRKLMIEFLQQTLAGFDCDTTHDPGRPVLRRLNRTEYDNAVLDLTGRDLRLADGFPPDPISYGFDNIGDALALSPAQVEMYHSAAKTIVSELLAAKVNRQQAFMDADPNLDPPEQARSVLTEFASRAFRQPADPNYVNQLLRIYDQAITQQLSHDEAIGHGMTAILMSSRFLMRVELDQVDADAPYRVSDYELASRLSFFLWSRPPDSTLLSLAESNRLHDPQVLESQLTRMLKDDRSGALVTNFFFQWLDLRNLVHHTPDPGTFPEFDEELRRAMAEESRMLLADVVQQDQPVTHLIDAGFAYLNKRLADHYGIKGVTAAVPTRVVLTDQRRGGIVTSAAFLMLQSDPGRTNIPRRGNFIAAQFLGDAAPPPPPDVPPLERVDDGAKRSLRETFELHRSSASCKGCHQGIDPLGFSLENYDAIGRWREQDAGFPVDASAEMASGITFRGPDGLKSFLLTHKDEFLRTFSTKLLIYALGRGLESSDECVVDDMVQAAKQNEYRISSMITELVTSTPFTHRQNPDY